MKAAKFATSVDGAVGEHEIASMWYNHFNQLYNSVNDDGAKTQFYNRLSEYDIMNCDKNGKIKVRDIVNAIQKQKCGKATGPDGIAMEAFINGGLRLAVHLCILFNIFIDYQYLPKTFMQSVMIPLIKCKSGDLSDVNNYRAIALSNAITKLLESVLAEVHLHVITDTDYQFGFKGGHSTSLCTTVLKETVHYYTQRHSSVFACFVDFSKAFDRVNYWKLFNKLLDDSVDPNVV
jgi:hypothetical protein